MTTDISTGPYVEELQIVNGYYVTNNYPNAYLDYSNYYKDISTKNSLNYVIASNGYRYATFAWKCATNASNYSKIEFVINGLTQTITTPDSAPQVNGNNLYMFYRIEDTSHPSTSSSNFTADYRNTTWLNAYGFGYGYDPITSSNYNNISKILCGKNTDTSYPSSFTGNALTMNVLTPSFSVSSSDNVYIYLRIGLPMSANLGFSYVTATLS